MLFNPLTHHLPLLLMKKQRLWEIKESAKVTILLSCAAETQS